MKNKKKTPYLVAAVVAVLAIIGVAVGVSRSGPSTSNHDAADVAFAQDMIPHHEQAVEMAQYVDGRSTDPRVIALAGQIEGAQSPEIRQMTGWLQSWHQSVPSNHGGMAMGGVGMGGATASSGMLGMMSDSDMSMLQTLSGPGFDRMWLTMMTTHHTGAIDMAGVELARGRYPAAQALARSITSSQAAQVAQMRRLLAQI